MEFLDSLYFDYLVELPVERREEFFSILDNFFNERSGTFSDMYNAKALEVHGEDTNITEEISRSYSEQFAIDIDTYKFTLEEFFMAVTSAKYWVVFEFLKVQDNVMQKDLLKSCLDAEEDMFKQCVKFYNAYPKHKKKSKMKNNKVVIDFAAWKNKLEGENVK